MAITVDAKELEVLRLLVEYGECRGLHLVKVSEARGGNLRRGTVYLTLSDMVDRQLIESRTELGMAQLYYRVTSIGRRAAERTDDGR